MYLRGITSTFILTQYRDFPDVPLHQLPTLLAAAHTGHTTRVERSRLHTADHTSVIYTISWNSYQSQYNHLTTKTPKKKRKGPLILWKKRCNADWKQMLMITSRTAFSVHYFNKWNEQKLTNMMNKHKSAASFAISAKERQPADGALWQPPNHQHQTTAKQRFPNGFCTACKVIDHVY